MQATDEEEVTYQLVVRMGKRKYETELEYTMAQAEEINKMVLESARAARGNNWSIRPRKVKFVD